MFKGKTMRGVAVSSTFGFNEALPGITWILVANRTGAKLFESKSGDKRIEFPKEFACPKGRMRGSESYRDRPGRSFQSTSQSHGGHGTSNPRHAYGSEVTPHELVAQEFSRGLAAMLHKGRNSRRFQKLVLVSEPHFLGVLCNELSSPVRESVVRVLEKDIAELPNGVLGQRLSTMLRI